MKAVIQQEWGSAVALTLADIEPPVPRDDQVRVEVHAASVDWSVWHLMTGLPCLVRLMGYGFRAPASAVPGLALAGRVESVGARVTRFQPGDAVFGSATGAFAELACADEAELALKPDNLGYDEAATLPYGGLTALQGLRDHGQVSPGQKVLVIGASGAVGSFGVQIAGSLGAEVTGVCSAAKADFVLGQGASNVIDYKTQDIVDGTTKYHVIFDIAGRRRLSLLRRALTERGILVIVGGEGGDRFTGGSYRQLAAMVLSPLLRQRLCSFITRDNAEDLERLAAMTQPGQIAVNIARKFALAEASDAIRYLESGQACGSIVLTMVTGEAARQ
jgi:NADPH:quinone reductase-like Zn-dependent oxidoreductase